MSGSNNLQIDEILATQVSTHMLHTICNVVIEAGSHVEKYVFFIVRKRHISDFEQTFFDR